MALHGNCSRSVFGVCRFFGGVHSTAPGMKARTRQNWIRQDLASTVLSTSGNPTGASGSVSYSLPLVTGEVSSRVDASQQVTAAVAGGLAASSNLNGSGTVSQALMGLIVALSAALTGGSSTSALLNAIAPLASAISASGTVSSATATALGNLVSAITASGSVSSLIIAKGALNADIVVTGSTLSTANVGEAVWGALSALFNEAGTMGERLNSAGSAGDPWGTALPGAYTAGSAGYLVGTNLDQPISDLAAGLLAEVIDGTIDVKGALRLILAFAAGDKDATTIRAADNDAKVRITYSASGEDRVVSGLDTGD